MNKHFAHHHLPLKSQENLLNKTATIIQPPKLKDVMEENIGIDNDNDVDAWLLQVESIISDDKYRIIKIIWYLTGLCFIAIWQFLLPQRAIFFGSTEFKYFSFDIITQIYFIIDLFVQWNLFKKREKTRSSQRRLQFLDWIITIPWPFIGLFISWKIYYYFRLIDLLRISRLKHYWNDMRHELVHYTGRIISIHAGLSAIIFHIFALLLIASYCACFWYIIAITQSNNCPICKANILNKP